MARPTPTGAVIAALERIGVEHRDGIWIALVDPGDALAAAAEVERRMRLGDVLPLAGLTCAVKGNIDVSGLPTTAACPAFATVPDRSAPVVRLLEAAGAVVMGVTNLDQFATGLVGTRSPYGICPNVGWPELISGGSSSGSAAAVAAGLVDFALGTDTAGSGRVPAAANGLVGLKPTHGRLSLTGVVPACRSLDCVSVLARSVELASLVIEVAAASSPDPADAWSRHEPLRAVPGDRRWRVGVPPLGTLDFDGDASGPDRFAAAVERLRSIGVDEVPVDVEPFVAAGRLLYGGAFVAERFEAVGAFVQAHLEDVDPVVGPIVVAAGELPAWELSRDRTELERLRRLTLPVWDRVDVVMVPSVPRLPAVAEVVAEPVAVNSMLGTYTNFVNLLDLCALALPIRGTSGDDGAAPPPSVTLIAPAWSEDVLVGLGLELTSAL